MAIVNSECAASGERATPGSRNYRAWARARAKEKRERSSPAERKRRRARARGVNYKEHSERRVRIAPAAPEALIRFHPRGRDVALTCTGRYHHVFSFLSLSLFRAPPRVPDDRRCCSTATATAPLYPSCVPLPLWPPRENRFDLPRGRPRANVNPRCNLSVTVVSRRMLALDPR